MHHKHIDLLVLLVSLYGMQLSKYDYLHRNDEVMVHCVDLINLIEVRNNESRLTIFMGQIKFIDNLIEKSSLLTISILL